MYTISYLGNFGVVDDPATKTYFNNDNGVYRFAKDTVGHGQTPGPGPTFTPAVVSIIRSDRCGTQLALDHLRRHLPVNW